MSHCVPDWDGPGGELEAILATTDYFPPVVKGKWGSSPQKRADLSDLAPVRVVDAGQSQWNGEMVATQAAHPSRGRNGQWEGNCPNDDWSGGQETGDAVTPSKPLNYSSPPVVKESCLAVDVPVIDTTMNTSPHQEDEMVSWLQYPTDEPHYKLDEPQYPLDDCLESNYCSEFFGKLPNSNLANTQSVRDSFALAGQQQSSSTPGGRSSRNSPLATAGNNNNIGSLNRVASADVAMALGAGRAAGLLPQAGGVEAFTKVRTTMQQPKWSPNSSPNSGKYHHPGASSAALRPPPPDAARTMPSGAPPLSSPMLTPNKPQAPVPPPLQQQQQPARLGHMNFSHFSRPAVQMKANLQCLASHHTAAGVNRLKMSPLGGTARPFDGAASSGSSIAESTTTRPSSGVSGKESDVPVEGSEGQQQSLGGTETSWPSSSMQNSLSSKDNTEPAAPSAGDNVEAGSQPAETSENRPSSSVATGSEAPGGPDKSVSQAAPEVQDPAEATLTSSSGNSADRGKGVTSRGKKRAREDETECQSDVAEEEVVELKKPQQRGGTVKRTRAAEVHNLSERRRRDRINEKMKALQELIPNSNKADKASMLDEAIAYLKMLQVQLVDICRKSGLTIPSVIPTGMQHLQMPQMGTMLPPMGIGMGMSMGHMVGMGVLDCMAAGRPSHAIPHLAHGPSHSGSPLLPHISHGGPFPMMPLPSHGAGGPSHSVSATSPAVSMGDGHDLRLPSNSALESAYPYRARQHALQMNHPQAMDVYGAYMIHQHHQLHHLANNMSGAPPHHLANNMSGGPPHHLQNNMSSGPPHHLPVNMSVGPPHHVPSNMSGGSPHHLPNNMSGGSPHHSGPPQHLPNMNCGPSHHLPNNMGGGGP